MNLSAGASYGALVNAVPDNPAARQAGLLRVVPGDPSRSFLLTKITMPGPAQGSRMPQGMNPLPPSDIESIQQWILAGAPRTGTRGPTPTQTPIGPPASATASEPPTATPTPPATATDTPTPPATATATETVTGTPPATATASATPSSSATAAESPTPTASPTPSEFDQIQQMFTATCTDMFCHDQQSRAGNLVLVAGQSYAQLVGMQPDNLAARNAGLLRVTPDEPDQSFLVIKLEGPPPIMGSRMPLLKDPLTPAEIERIRRWIADGAPE